MLFGKQSESILSRRSFPAFRLCGYGWQLIQRVLLQFYEDLVDTLECSVRASLEQVLQRLRNQ